MEQVYEHGNWVIFGVGIYMLIMLYIGYVASKKVSATADYVVAGRRLNLFLATGTMLATWFGAGTAMGGAGNAYLFGNQGVIFDPWSSVVCLVILALFFAKLMRRGRYLTIADLFHLRYGKTMGLMSVVTLAISEMGWLGSQLVAFGTIIHFFTGMPLLLAIAISTLIVTIYTYAGGMWAVSITDVFQMIIVIAGLILLLVIAVPKIGGWGSIFSNSPDGNWSGINQWSFFYTPESAADPEIGNAGYFFYTGHKGIFYALAAWLSLGFGALTAQDTQQRLLSAKDEKTSALSTLFAAGGYVVFGMMPVIAGMLYYRINPDLSVDDAMSKILLLMSVKYLPTIATVIFVSALVAALMSSADSAILAASSVIGYNGYKLIKPDVSDAKTLKLTKLMVPTVTIVSLVLALWFQVIFNLMVIAWTLLLVSLFPSYIAGYFWKKANRNGAIASYFGGMVTWILAFLAYLPATKEANTDVIPGVTGVYWDWAMWDSLYIASIWGLIGAFVALIVVSLATQKKNAPLPLVDIDGNPMAIKNWTIFSGFKNKG